MPTHPVYCEPFLGGGAVMRLKRPAAYNIGVDLDAEVIAAWRSREGENTATRGGELAGAAGEAEMPGRAAFNLVGAVDSPLSADAGGIAVRRRHGPAEMPADPRTAGSPPVPGSSGVGIAAHRSRTAELPGADTGGGSTDCGSAAASSRFRFLRGDGLTFLASYPFQPADLVYCDPPYLMETRSGGRLYRHELEDGQHAELLSTILELPCRVMISGYWSEMYACRLKRWNSVSFEAMTRGGMATEWLWFNFAEPVELHDYRFLGATTRQRQDLKRQIASWTGKLERMPALKKRALLAAIAGRAANGGNAAGIR